VGKRGYDEYRDQWTMFTFDTTDRARPGKPRTREWLAVGTSELHVLQETRRHTRPPELTSSENDEQIKQVVGDGDWLR
jgi:hypothetical protein